MAGQGMLVLTGLTVLLCLNAVTASRELPNDATWGNQQAMHVVVSRDDPRGKPVVAEVNELYRGRACASGWFQAEMESVGWNFLRVETNPDCRDTDQAYAAGYVEGALTRKQIKEYRINTIDQDNIATPLRQYLQENQAYLESMTHAHHSDKGEAEYWWQVRLVMEQVQGIQDGYNARAAANEQLPEYGIIIMNSDGDLYDLIPAFFPDNVTSLVEEAVKPVSANVARELLRSGQKRVNHGQKRGHSRPRTLPQRCSGMVMVLPGNKDLYMSQATFTGLEEMLRIFKLYDFAFETRRGSEVTVPGRRSLFSSYPGHVYSGDDFYVQSSGVCSVETTINNYNLELYQKFIHPNGSVLEWYRNVVANRLARTAQDWSEIFAKYNSGTYNNQWLVVDYNKFTPGEDLPDGLLYVLEQLPGYVEFWDATAELREKRFYASINIPASPKIYKLAGWEALAKQFGKKYFGFYEAPRALIFARDHVKVRNIDDFKHMMRYNDFKHDPLSSCSDCKPPYDAEFAPSSRGDLNSPNGTYPLGYMEQNDHSSVDCKVTSSALVKRMSAITVFGPTCDQQPVFQWSKSDFHYLSHVGHPDVMNFPWLKVEYKDSRRQPWLKLHKNSSLCHAKSEDM